MEGKVGFTYFGAKMDFDALDEKLQRFVELRNELKMLAKEIGFEVEHGLLELNWYSRKEK